MAISKKITPEILDFWLQHGYNVLFEGRHGVGKTAIVKECFERNNLKWKYFSAATMDPWCDFIGIPKTVKNVAGEDILKYVLPPDFADDSVEALFFDEFNRSHKKVRDAVMELIQFKSINGRPFKNLKVVWAAINPPGDSDRDGEYQVEKLDPALKDRFHIYVQVPFTPDATFFRDNFGSKGKNAVEWWRELPADTQRLVSPRRLEYALGVHGNKGNMSYVLPKECNILQLEQALAQGTIATIAKKIMTEGDKKAAISWLADANNLNAVIKLVGKSKETREFFVPLIPDENLVLSMSKNSVVMKYVVDSESKQKHFTKILDSILEANQNKKIVNYIRKNRVLNAPPSSVKTLLTSYKMVKAAKQTTHRWRTFNGMLETVLTWNASPVVTKTFKSKSNKVLYEALLLLWSKSQEGTVQYNYGYQKIIKKARKTLDTNISGAVRTGILRRFVKHLPKNVAAKVKRMSSKFKV